MKGWLEQFPFILIRSQALRSMALCRGEGLFDRIEVRTI